MNDDLEIIWNSVRGRTEVLSRNHEKLSQGNRRAGRESNRVTPGYKSTALPPGQPAQLCLLFQND
jgi:hypothetical protein